MAEPLEISVQGTPNPNAAKFTLNKVVATQGKTYRLPAPARLASPNEAAGTQVGNVDRAEPAWANQLLGIAGVTQVFAMQNFISITKAPEANWDVIAPQAEQILRRAFI